MPRLPDYTQVGRTPAQSDRTIVGGAEPVEALAKARLGEQIAGIGQDLLERRARIRAAEVESKAAIAGMQAEADFENDNEFETIVPRYREKLERAHGDLLREVKNPLQREVLQVNLRAQLDQGSVRMAQKAAAKEKDFGRASLLNTVSENRASFLRAGTPEAREAILTATSNAIQQGYDGGYINAQEAVEQRRQLSEDFATAKISLLPLDEQIDVLSGKKQDPIASYIPDDQRLVLMQRAIERDEAITRAELTAMERAERVSEKQKKEVMDETAKNGDQLLSEGSLTTDWIEENRDNLDGQDYRYFYKALRNGDSGSTNLEIYSDLRTRASEGEDVRREAREQLQRGTLKVSDYDKLVTRSEENAGVSSLPNWYKRGEKYIGSALQVSDINPDPAAAQRRAAAMDDWTQWAADNPNSDEKMARDAYQRITKEYALINFSNMTLTKPLPRFAVGDRASLDIEASQRATVAAFQNKEISEEDFRRQAQLLKEWDDAMSQMRGTGGE